MKTISASIATAGFSALLLATSLTAQTNDEAPSGSGPAPASTVSQVRIVRLSEVKGFVLLDRNNGRGFETAVTNMPIVNLNRLETGEGVAEVEFEDNSTLRIAPKTIVEFPQLDRLASGATATSVLLVKGTAYVSLLKTKSNEFNLMFAGQKLALPAQSHVRLQLDGGQARLAVLEGTVQIDGPSGAMDVGKQKTVTFDLQGQGGTQPAVARNVAEASFDEWDQSAAKYHAHSVPATALNSSPYAYGSSDMAYYGDFMNAGGCGSMWRPYFASAAWDPYANGTWAWYGGGGGYSWVSPYPWGWTPYHYGSWAYCPGVGYGWLPGGAWNGLNNIASGGPVNGPGHAPINGPGHLPIRPLRPPLARESTLTAVNLKPLVHSEANSEDSFVFRKDSAGMGIPREGLGSLNRESRQTLDHGMATRDISNMSGPYAPNNEGRPGDRNGAVPSNRQEPSRQSEPSRSYEPQQRFGGGGEMPSHTSSGGGPSGSGAPSGGAPSGGSAPSGGRGH